MNSWWKFSNDLFAANLEAQRVIALRVYKLALGGSSAQKEAERMVSEKMLASVEAATTVAAGGSPQKILRRYRTIMRANAKRLSKKRP
ncbi:MAG: hypothetical protein ABIN69_06125 [Aestuariivirga sp.]